MELIIIAAVSRNNFIGVEGKLPWHSKSDLSHFKQTTLGFPVIMGRKTWDSIGSPLAGRTNIILTKQSDFSFSHPNVVICHTISEVFRFLEGRKEVKGFVIGGAEIFEQFLPFATGLIISRIPLIVEGDRQLFAVEEELWNLDRVEKFPDLTIEYYSRKGRVEPENKNTA